jgi:hypothetical protein
MADAIETSADVTARRHSNRVCNLKRGLYIDNSRMGGWFAVPCRVEEEGKYSISIFQCLHRTGGVWKVTLLGPNGEVLLDPAMDFYDPYLAWKENRPENFLYGTWFEKKAGIHKLIPGDYTFRFECVGSHPLARAEDSDGPGLNCRLDGISLRRFPWDDLFGQMDRYLAEEKERFAEMVAQAEKTVANLDAAVGRYYRDTGEYPRSFDELLRRPEQISATVPDRPYLAGIPADPWGQSYRYSYPGKFNPDGFDVYSVHGDSREPAAWIGNWPNPFHIPDALEGEDLRAKAKSEGVILLKQEAGVASFPPLSRGRLLFIRLQKKGDSIDLALPPAVKPGRYLVRLRLVTSWDYAIVRASFNGTPLGGPVDTYSPKIDTKTVVLGPVDVKAEGNVFRLEAVDQNAASTGYYAGIDALVLIADKRSSRN